MFQVAWGSGQTSSDHAHLPGYPPFDNLIVGNEVINVLVVYVKHGGGVGGPGVPYINIDAFNETTGEFLNNFFVDNIAPDAGLLSNANVYGSVAYEPHIEKLHASATPMHTAAVFPNPPVPDSSATFDKWVKLEGPAGNPVMAGQTLEIGASPASDITAFAFYKDPASTYITGGYQSPDIILFTPFSATTVGTQVPIGAAGTTLVPGNQYGFAAVVHNDSTYEVSTQVTFWNIPGGCGTMGTFLDTQTVTIPASSSRTVISSLPFVNPLGHHCAAVSLYTADSPCNFHPTNSADSINIPDPYLNYSHSCSAWRNTNAMFCFHHGQLGV